MVVALIRQHRVNDRNCRGQTANNFEIETPQAGLINVFNNLLIEKTAELTIFLMSACESKRSCKARSSPSSVLFRASSTA